MASPYSTGGGGTHFEAHVVAYYLAALLAEAPARGVAAPCVTKVLTQRADFGAPLDDVIVEGRREDGTAATLHLQVKSDLAFTTGDAEWVSVVKCGWDTFSGKFDAARDRWGVAVANYNAKVDRHYQSVLNWAAHSTCGRHFIERITKKDFSHQDRGTFVNVVRSIIDKYTNTEVSDETLWHFLRSCVIFHFDLSGTASSRDAQSAEDRIRNSLPLDIRDRAPDIWQALIVKAGALMPAGGGDTRTTLAQYLQSEGLPIAISATYWRDVHAIDQESHRALSVIKSDVHGLRLHRRDAHAKVWAALESGRFIQIDGEPGAGKSALLKEIAEETARSGPIFVLKDTRIHPRGWAAHAAVLQVTGNLRALLIEMGLVTTPILFIDGIDRITDPASHVTINDLVVALATDPALSRWRILATVREQNLEHINTWLSPDAISKLNVRTVTVDPLGPDELDVVAATFPRLRPLLLDSGNTDVILRRPFFLEAMLQLAGRNGITQLPASEVELMQLWWRLGGGENLEPTSAQHRRNALLTLGDRLAAKPNFPIPIRDIPPEPINDLKSAGVIRDKQLGHSVVFTHDIYEEWVLSQYLLGALPSISQTLKNLGEPQELVRPLQLLGSVELENNDTDESWRELFKAVSDSALRPVWQRAVLTSCLRSTRTSVILSRLSDYLSQDEHAGLKKLLTALQTLEVVPNPIFLRDDFFPDLTPEERVRLAQHSALPKLLTWVRFLDWFMLRSGDLSPTLLPTLLPVFSTWQQACGGKSIRHCREIGEIAYKWLREFEDARHAERWDQVRRPFGMKLDHDEEERLETAIRGLFCASAGDVPELATQYLQERAQAKQKHVFRRGILENSNTLSLHVPAALVDYLLTACLKHPKEKHDRWESYSRVLVDDLGLEDSFSFYPASPLQAPFLALLRNHETEGLRLVQSLCNHAIDVWIWSHRNGGKYSNRATPIGLPVVFSWGKQTFWGDAQVYCWFRALWGNSAVNSALMALEQWALERIEAGDAFDTVFRKAIDGHKSVAALGLATSLCLAHPAEAIYHTLPLITCPNIWMWDIERMVHDMGSPNNEIANWFQHRHLMIAVRTLNRKPHRHLCIRSLVPHFVYHRDPAVRRRYTAGIRRFPQRLPFSFAEEKQSDDAIALLRERMIIFSQQADPRYWHKEPAPDGKGVLIWNDPPFARSEQHREEVDKQKRFNSVLGLALWTQKTLDDGKLPQNQTIDIAVEEAKALDASLLFETPIEIEDPDDFYCKAAVVGVAFVATRFADAGIWNEALAAWCFDVLSRAAVIPENGGTLRSRGSLLSFHPVVFAAHGFAALLKRGYRVRETQSALLSLAVDPLEAVLVAVAQSSTLYSSEFPEFHWTLFHLLVSRCIYEDGAHPNFHSVVWDDAEGAWNLTLLEHAEAALDQAIDRTLPSIPMPWIKEPEAEEDSDHPGFIHNAVVFDTHLAQKAILRFGLDGFLHDPERRAELVGFVFQLNRMTLHFIHPPFAQSRRRSGADTPFEWVYAFYHWLGGVAAKLNEAERHKAILEPLFRADNESALLAMETFVPSFLAHALLDTDTINDGALRTWMEIAVWVLENEEGRRLNGAHVDRHYATCAFALLFCFSGDFRPLGCLIDERWPHLNRFLSIVERAIHQFGVHETLYIGVLRFFKGGGVQLLPDPGLCWLDQIVTSNKQDRSFWRANGEETVELLRMVLQRKSQYFNGRHRILISRIADILVDNGVRGAGFLQQDLLRA